MSVILPYIHNASDTMKEPWQSKIDLKLVGSLEIIHNDAEETTQDSVNFQGFDRHFW
jgi:hypothetical protein